MANDGPAAACRRMDQYPVEAQGGAASAVLQVRPWVKSIRSGAISMMSVIVLPQWWAEARVRIESIDEKANVVRFTGDCFRPANGRMAGTRKTSSRA